MLIWGWVRGRSGHDWSPTGEFEEEEVDRAFPLRSQEYRCTSCRKTIWIGSSGFPWYAFGRKKCVA